MAHRPPRAAAALRVNAVVRAGNAPLRRRATPRPSLCCASWSLATEKPGLTADSPARRRAWLAALQSAATSRPPCALQPAAATPRQRSARGAPRRLLALLCHPRRPARRAQACSWRRPDGQRLRLPVRRVACRKGCGAARQTKPKTGTQFCTLEPRPELPRPEVPRPELPAPKSQPCTQEPRANLSPAPERPTARASRAS